MASDDRPTGPLHGVTIVDLTSSYAGPTATRYLASLGAAVIKVEPVRGDDARQWGPPFVAGESAWFLSANAGKRSIALDLRDPEGQRILDQLLARADVLVENYTPAKLGSLGLDPDDVRARHPQLIYCAITGFGLRGPSRDRPGYDLIAQARSGMMSVTGSRADDPQRVGTALSDVSTGIVAALAISAALVSQQQTGRGELIDVSLLGTDLALMNPRISSFLAGEPEPRACNGEDSVLSIYQRFDTADRPLVVAVGNDRAWLRFCELVERPDLAARPELASNAGRRQHRVEIVAELKAIFRQRSSAEWAERLGAAHIPYSEILTLSEVVRDEQVVAADHLRTGQTASGAEFTTVRPPWVLGDLSGDSPARPTEVVPALGEHTGEVLRSLGYESDRIGVLEDRGVIRQGSSTQ